jgi:hypothetical protein
LPFAPLVATEDATFPNYFGASLAYDDLLESFYVGCPYCRSSSSGDQGAIYVFEQDPSLPLAPSAFKRWHLSQELHWPGITSIAKEKMVISKDLMLVDSSSSLLLFRKNCDTDPAGRFHPDTTIDLDKGRVTDFDLHEDLVAISVSPTDALSSAPTAIYLLSISRAASPSLSSSWSVQQILSPIEASEKDSFDEAVVISLDGKRLTVMTNALDLFVYERSDSLGLWSVQQVIVSPRLPSPSSTSPPCTPCTTRPPLATRFLRGLLDSSKTWNVLTIIESMGEGRGGGDLQHVRFSVTDLSGHHLIASGSFCESSAMAKTSSASCWIDLPDGEYLAQLTESFTESSASHFFQWQYCDLKDPISSQEQLTIAVKDGVCSVIAMKSQREPRVVHSPTRSIVASILQEVLPVPFATHSNLTKEEEGGSSTQSFSYYHHPNSLPYLFLITSGTVLVLVIGLVISIRPLTTIVTATTEATPSGDREHN